MRACEYVHMCSCLCMCSCMCVVGVFICVCMYMCACMTARFLQEWPREPSQQTACHRMSVHTRILRSPTKGLHWSSPGTTATHCRTVPDVSEVTKRTCGKCRPIGWGSQHDSLVPLLPLEVRSHPGLHREFKASLGSLLWPCLKIKNKKDG